MSFFYNFVIFFQTLIWEPWSSRKKHKRFTCSLLLERFDSSDLPSNASIFMADLTNQNKNQHQIFPDDRLYGVEVNEEHQQLFISFNMWTLSLDRIECKKYCDIKYSTGTVNRCLKYHKLRKIFSLCYKTLNSVSSIFDEKKSRPSSCIFLLAQKMHRKEIFCSAIWNLI